MLLRDIAPMAPRQAVSVPIAQRQDAACPAISLRDKALAFSFAGIARDFLTETGKRLDKCAYRTRSGRRLPPKSIVRTTPSESGVRMPTVRAPIAAAVSTAG